MAADPKRVKDIFLEAAEEPNEAARAAYLDRACAGDAGLRERVEALLRCHDPGGSFLDKPAGVVADLNRGDTVALDPTPSPDATGDGDGKPRSATRSADKNVCPTGDEESDDLQFLSPSTRSDSLGRLGHYEMLQVLGKGGFGIVFRAFDDMLQRVVALKVMAPQIASLSPARKRFVREARSSASVRHENVVQIYEVGEQPLPYLAMEFIPGETLQHKLDRCGPLDVPEVLRIGRQVAEGLAAAHACDLIHRDIKPGNVLLEGGSHKAKITDFGLARAADDASISQSGIIAGTPMFMSPEQALGHKIDQRADLFSLGSVLYQMASGRPPFRAPSTLAVLKRVAEEPARPIQEIIPETPEWLCGIIAKLHAKKPEERFQSAREVADLLADCEAKLKAKQEVKNVLPAAVRPAAPAASGGRKWAAAAVVLMLPVITLAVTEFAGVTYLFRGQPTPDPIGPAPIRAAKVASDADGWVQLFNGRDLTGWKTHPDQPGDWRVEEGVLIGRGHTSHLFTERGDYRNFHVRVEARIDKGGNSGLWFRSEFGASRVSKDSGLKYPRGHEADIGYSAEERNQLGSLGAAAREHYVPPPAQPGEWFVMEVIALDDHIVVRVDGQTTVDYVDPQNRYAVGHLALQSGGGGKQASVQFRKIQIKELATSAPAPEAKTSPPAVGTFTDADLQRIAALSAAEQVEEVRKELMRRNPGFDGTIQHKIEGSVVTELRIDTDQVTDIAPIRLFNALRVLDLSGSHINFKGNGQLVDLSPLSGMNLAGLTVLNLNWTMVGDEGLAHFRNCKKLTHLGLDTTQVSDTGLAYFKDYTDLTYLNLNRLKISDAGLAHFKNCKNLKYLHLGVTPVGDAGLSYFKECEHLTLLGLSKTRVTDAGLAHFKDCKKLANLALMATPVTDAGLAHFKDSKELTRLHIGYTKVTDLSLIKGMPLKELDCPFRPERDAEILRSIKTLEKINGKPAEQFWKEVEEQAALAVHDTWIKAVALLPLDQHAAALPAKLKERLPGFEDALLRTIPSMAADRQAIMVAAWLRDRNSAFAGDITHQIEGGVLTSLEVTSPLVQDLTPLRALPALKSFTGRGTLGYDNQATRDAAVLQALKALETINGKPVAQFWKDAEARQAEFQEYLQLVPTLTAPQQVAAVVAKLKERNPGLDGTSKRKIEGGMVTELAFDATGATDLSPVRALVGLKTLICTRGPLSDLSPLEGMPLNYLSLSACREVRTLEPLKGMPLISLNLDSCSQVRDLEPLKDMPLTSLALAFCSQVQDLSPLKGMPLTFLNLYGCGVRDLEPLKGMPLTRLGLAATQVRGLEPLTGMPLTSLDLRSCSQVQDLSPLKGMPLKVLSCYSTGVTELNPLQSMELEEIRLTPKNITQGLDILRDMKSLKSIGIGPGPNQVWPAAEFWERYDKGEFSAAPFTDADVQRIAALPVAQQVAAVVARLKERNPGLEGTATHKIENGVVTELAFIPVKGQDVLTDLSPLRALPGLTSLNLWSCSGLEDLESLKGMKLTRLLIGSLQVSIQVRDLEPLRGMPLTELQLYQCQVQNLEPLRDMPLTRLGLFSRQVGSCEPLTGMPLTVLGLGYCSQIQDFTRLKDLPLTGLHLDGCQVRDLEPFKGMKLTRLQLSGAPVRDLELLKGMPLKHLSIQKTGVTDLRPLQGMELEEIYLTPKNITQGLDIVRGMKSLNKVGIDYNQAWSAAEFWERYDKGEFKSSLQP